jgi:hypothetical protein
LSGAFGVMAGFSGAAAGAAAATADGVLGVALHALIETLEISSANQPA